MPTKLATYRLAGYSYTSPGVPTCAIRPSAITAMRLASVMASSWSCVTTTKVSAELILQVGKLELRVLTQLLVERRKWLIEQQQLRPLDQCAGKRHPLLLPAGKLVRLAIRERFELDEREHLARRAP